MDDSPNRFGQWLDATMQSRGLSQAEVAREVGVADAQVSRWRRGQVRPTVRYLQRIADTFDVSRPTLDRMAGYPVGDTAGGERSSDTDPAMEAELQAYQARYRELLESRLPPDLWDAYVRACEALADRLASSFQEVLSTAETSMNDTVREVRSDPGDRSIGFHTRSHGESEEGGRDV